MKSKNMTLTGQGRSQSESSHSGIFKFDEQDICVIKFDDVKVRVVNIHVEPWFIAVDVCKALETDNPTKAIKALDVDEKTLTSIQGIHAGPGNPVINAVSESGFYKLISRSRKATTPGTFAHRFTNWVFREVIPSIRKTGSYGVPWALLHDFAQRSDDSVERGSQAGKALFIRKVEKRLLLSEQKQLLERYQPQLALEGVTSAV